MHSIRKEREKEEDQARKRKKKGKKGERIKSGVTASGWLRLSLLIWGGGLPTYFLSYNLSPKSSNSGRGGQGGGLWWRGDFFRRFWMLEKNGAERGSNLATGGGGTGA